MASFLTTAFGRRAVSPPWPEGRPFDRSLRPSRHAATLQRKPRQSAPLDSVLSNDISSRFGRRLRELRHSRSLTQADMARRFGIDRSFISEIECGRKAVSLPMIEIIALGLQVSLSELLQDL